MTFWQEWLPFAIVLTSLLPGLLIFTLREEQRRLRTWLNMTGVVLKLLLVGVMLVGVSRGRSFHFELPFLPDAPLILQADALSLLFVSLSSLLWLATTVYAIGYLEGAPLRSRFFGYFSLCVSATVGVALAGNLVTLLTFYELLTLATLPLVMHWGNRESLAAGRVYLAYTVSGGILLLMAVALLHGVAGSPQFASGGYIASLLGESDAALCLAFFLFVAGLGVKAAIVPLHGWLPAAMVAPAPVSALLHAVAVVKAGAFGLVRVMYDVYGVDALGDLRLAEPVLALACVTVLYGSIKALQQTGLKKRLAYSTVSQVSYIVLGAALVSPLALVGGLVHLVHQGLMKVTLFYCAGNFAEAVGVHDVRDMNGLGHRMPWTMAAFTVAAIGMIGVPPSAGFISKWYLGVGALEAGLDWVVLVLVLSSLLNAAYFLPLIYRGWFGLPSAKWAAGESQAALTSGRRQCEIHWMLLVPTLFTATLTLLVGVIAGSDISPLAWSRLIVERSFEP